LAALMTLFLLLEPYLAVGVERVAQAVVRVPLGETPSGSQLLTIGCRDC
jgi:hypothetical protein